MRVIRRHKVVVQLSLLAAPLLVANLAPAQAVWPGLTETFSKAAFSDHTLPENQDSLTTNVVITRRSTGGIINIVAESFFNQNVSPTLTEWATDLNNPGETIAATNWNSLLFTNWLDAYGGPLTGGAFIAGRDAVVHLIPDDIYLDLRFTAWTAGNGGGYSYLRAKPPAAGPAGDYHNDGFIDAADYVLWRSDPGSYGGAQGYTDWVNNFGQTLGSGAAASANAVGVPEPASVLLLTLGVTFEIWRRRRISLRVPITR
jgi:hypothetical protein